MVDTMRIFAIGAHPDDIEFGCGGTLVHFREKHNAELEMLIMSNCNDECRKDEQERASKIIGATCKVLYFQDTYLNLHIRECINTIEQSLYDLKPTHVFAPYYEDTHQDHRALSEATISAMRESTNLLFYESISTKDMKPNLLQNIDESIDNKCNSLDMHISQKHLNLSHKARILAEYRAFRMPFKYAEAFASRKLMLGGI